MSKSTSTSFSFQQRTVSSTVIVEISACLRDTGSSVSRKLAERTKNLPFGMEESTMSRTVSTGMRNRLRLIGTPSSSSFLTSVSMRFTSVVIALTMCLFVTTGRTITPATLAAMTSLSMEARKQRALASKVGRAGSK